MTRLAIVVWAAGLAAAFAFGSPALRFADGWRLAYDYEHVGATNGWERSVPDGAIEATVQTGDVVLEVKRTRKLLPTQRQQVQIGAK